MAKTKIICTLGPSSQNETILRKMMLAGMDVARLNFSHGDFHQHGNFINMVRRLNSKYRRRMLVLQDLEGYRIRIGKLNSPQGVALKRKQILLLSNKIKCLSSGIVPFDYEGSLKDIKEGGQLFIDDGNIALIVKSNKGLCLKTEVLIPGVIKENKGINIPDLKLSFSGLTMKDTRDIEFGIKNRVDFIAQSFVRDKNDIIKIREFIGPRLKNCKLIAKIENRDGIRNIDRIIAVADGIMIARGDMGVSIPIYEVPIVQKEIIRKCNRAKKFVITATQMLESMAEHIRPTRAEVTDVANAILDGTNFVMLSAESASGKHPVESVAMMNDIIKFTEKNRSSVC